MVTKVEKKSDLPKAAVVRIVKNAGVERITSTAIPFLIEATVDYINNTSVKAQQYAAHAGRKTINESDIKLALSE